VRIEDDASPHVADERIRVILFRAVRELLVNAATHANVREVAVRLACQDGLVRITVEDVGAGFDTADLDRRGYGLFGIGEQLKHVGGNLHVESVPGRGTTVTMIASVLSAPVCTTN
jgi:signal transduction histidine kinase